MSQEFSTRVRITYKELTDTKHFLDNQPKVRNAPRYDGNRRPRMISEETKRLLIRDITPSNRAQGKHAKETTSYPSNHGILRIPKEMDSILRSGDVKQKRVVNTNTVSSWDRFNYCAFQLSDMSMRKGSDIPVEIVNRARLLCDEMCDIAARILKSDMEFCTTHPIENELWYSGVYVLIELMRELSRSDPECSREFVSFLVSTMDYYTELISSIQSNYNFTLSILDSVDSIQSNSELKKIQRAVLCCHLSYLYLGDITRYQVALKEIIPDIGVSQECDWSTVTLYYQKAMQLSPTSGRPYNQLAIVSTNQFRYLDSVYFYMRCTSAYKAIPSVRESLLDTFYTIEKQTVTPVVSKDTKQKYKPSKQKNKFDNEVWILPDTSVEKKEDSSQAEQSKPQISQIPTPASFQKLCKDAYLSFLTIQAKFYTNIGIDSIPGNVTLFDNSISSLLNNRCNQSFAEVLLRMQLIVLFSLTNQNTESKHSHTSKLSFLFSFHYLLLQSMEIDLQKDVSMESNALYFVPLLRVFVQWLRHSTDIWIQQLELFIQHKIWSRLTCVVNNLKRVECEREEVLTNNNKHFLWEDQLLSGCVVTEKFINTRSSWDQLQLDIEDRVGFAVRMCLIVSDLRILCDVHNFPISFDVKECYFSVNIPQIGTMTGTNPVDELVVEENYFSDQDSNYFQDDKSVDDSDEEQNEFYLLKCEKNRLEAELNKQTLQINKHLEQQTTLRHEITPKYLVPDTNCFLSHLDLLQKIYISSHLQLIVPLIVLQELQQLRKPISKTQKHLSSCSRAKNAYSWLMDEFSNANKKIFALTNQGNLTENIYKQDFSTVRNKRNDDLILQSCVSLNEHWQISSDSDCIKSCVVLLTSDRNLRLKAVTQNLPAKSLKRFLTLMNICL